LAGAKRISLPISARGDRRGGFRRRRLRGDISFAARRGGLGRRRAASFDGWRTGVDVTVEDESGKIDLNAAPAPLLAALFATLNVEASQAQGLANAIAIWRGDQTTGPASDPNQAYRAAVAITVSGRTFKSIDELSLVLGMTPDLFQATKPHVHAVGRRFRQSADDRSGGGSKALRQVPPDPNAKRAAATTATEPATESATESGAGGDPSTAVALGADRAVVSPAGGGPAPARNGNGYSS